jgi:hypothetical protein
MSQAIEDIIAERERQIKEEGWSSEHDDKHKPGELALAGAAYAGTAHFHLLKGPGLLTWEERKPSFWPWHADWWKPTGFRRDLVKAAALILAEIERSDRKS